MTKKVGFIQSRGLGDILIGLPIAKYYHDRGYTVYWPIDERFLPSFADAVDYVTFLPFAFTPSLQGFLQKPLALLQQAGCGQCIPLYSSLGSAAVNHPVSNKTLAASLKFDEYKYAIAGVPFAEKWNLSIRRNREREEALYKKVVPADDYVVVHRKGSNFEANVTLPATFRQLPCVEVNEQSPSIFDWLTVFERARHLFLIDSCFSNLVDQLNLPTAKTFILRSEIRFTPVLRNSWRFYGAATPAFD